jgi:uncharacterized damage-inducible protein DinB
MAVAALVPAGDIDWTPGAGVMTFGDLMRHLAVCERWLFVEVALGRASRYRSHDRSLAPALTHVLQLLTDLHDDAMTELQAISDENWARSITTPAGARLPAHKWLRAMAEHEVHHRGQLYLMLRLRGVATPPIFGLTSEQVRQVGVD